MKKVNEIIFHLQGRFIFGFDLILCLFFIYIHFSTLAQWNHIVDLDSFFRRIYKYHQKNGFKVIAMEEILGLIQFILVVIFIIFACHCINYPVLFK